MKKRLLLIVAVVLGMTAMYAQKPVDLSSKYLKNYTQPYEYLNKISPEGDTIIDQNPEDAFRPLNESGTDAFANATVGGQTYSFYRFRKLPAPWVVEGSTTQEDGGQTGWHVDIQKGKAATIRGAITLTVGWDGFAPTIDNAKVYQTVTLPAGVYTFNAHYGQDTFGAAYAFLVANAGTSIPDTANLATALAHKRFTGLSTTSGPISIQFELTAETEVSLGIVASFPEANAAGNKPSLAVGDMRLGGFVDGTNYTVLRQLVTKANTMQAASYPLGVTGGKYSQEKWDAFVTARAEADTIARHENMDDPTLPGYVDNHTQAQVDAALAALQTAMDELIASFIVPFKVSTDTEERFYLLRDRRSPARYVILAEAEYDGAYKYRAEYATEIEKENEMNQFKFVKNPDGPGYFVVSRALGAQMSVGTAVANFLMFDPEVPGVPFNIKAAVGGFENYYRLFRQSNNQELNTFGGSTAGFIGFYTTTGQDAGSDFYFERVYGPGDINMTALRNEYAKVGTITPEQFPVGTGAGQFPQANWDAFVTAKDAAKAILDKEDTPEAPDQATVDAAVEELKAKLTELVAAMNPPMKFSTETEEVWYFMEDKRAIPWMWQYDLLNGRVMIAKKAESDFQNDESFQFKFVKPADAVGNEYFIYTKVAPEFPITYIDDDVETSIFAGFDAGADTVRFVSSKTPAFDAEYFTIAINGKPGMQLNSDYANGVLTFWNPGTTDDPGNDWKFVPVIGAGVKNATVQDLGIIVRNRRILSTDASAVINVFNVSGQRINVDKDLVPGVYVVTVKGKAGAAKVIVK